MRRTLSSFVAVLCLLMLFVSSAACLAAALPQDLLATQHDHAVNTAEHACCPQRSPAGEHLSTTCCTVHHQPTSASSRVEAERASTTAHALQAPVFSAAAVYPPAGKKLGRPPSPRLVALRI